MVKKILIDAAYKTELRVALLDGPKLFDLDIETRGKEQRKANIYKCIITRIEPSLEAVFVDYGAERHGFLPFREIAREYLNAPPHVELGRKNLREFLYEGQELIVQVDKEERGSKGAALTTFLSLAGCYLVLMPNNPRAGGISKRIEGEERAELREIISSLEIPEGMGLIIRTAGVGRAIEELQWDLNVLISQYNAIQAAAKERHAPFLIYQEGNAVIRAVRDYLKADVTEIIIDDKELYDSVSHHIKMVRPDFIEKVKFYDHKIPLFSRYQIESQIESVFKRELQLPSGGAIVIDHTEALISIDINSAKATKGGDIEETALQTNLEAADEIARQLRLRDIGGLIVIDFIDMAISRNQRAVEQKLKDALSLDRAKIQTGRISRFGLLEMSRQRLRPTIAESNQINCPRCEGNGTIHSNETLGVMISRVIEEEAIKEATAKILVEVPLELSAYLMNEKRATIASIEEKHNVKVIIIPNQNWQSPKYEVRRLKKDEIKKQTSEQFSYDLIPASKNLEIPLRSDELTAAKIETPAVQFSISDMPAPQPSMKAERKPVSTHADRTYETERYGKHTGKKKAGFLKKIWSSLVGEGDDNDHENGEKKPHHHPHQQYKGATTRRPHPHHASGRRHHASKSGNKRYPGGNIGQGHGGRRHASNPNRDKPSNRPGPAKDRHKLQPNSNNSHSMNNDSPIEIKLS